MRRVIVVLTDGLRPDAVTPRRMPALRALARSHTSCTHARTVRPSTTVAALATLATGLAPESHRLIEPGLGFLPRLARLRPVARELARAGHGSEIVASALDPMERSVVWALASAAGVQRFSCAGTHAGDVAAAALESVARCTGGVVFVYLNDCDRVGHAEGWMSPAYLAAASELDLAIGMLTHLAKRDLMIVVADHGGGGVTPTAHDEPHPANDHIPLVLAGPGVATRRRVARPVSILDLPPTMLAWLGVDVPGEYEGQVLNDAFAPRSVEVPV